MPVFTFSNSTDPGPCGFEHGDKSDPGNYHPVSLTSVPCKLIRERLVNHMHKNKMFSKKQFGFLSGRSTVLQLLNVLEEWTKILDEGGSLDAIYIDFMKAFDTVPHKRLLHKPNKYGFSQQIINLIKDFLS